MVGLHHLPKTTFLQCARKRSPSGLTLGQTLSWWADRSSQSGAVSLSLGAHDRRSLQAHTDAGHSLVDSTDYLSVGSVAMVYTSQPLADQRLGSL